MFSVLMPLLFSIVICQVSALLAAFSFTHLADYIYLLRSFVQNMDYTPLILSQQSQGNPRAASAFMVENYDVLFANNINFSTLLVALAVCLGLVLFLLLQANLLNLSFYPNATFDAEK